MSIDPRVLDAQNKVEAKRAKLMTSVKYGVGEAKRRLAPDLLAEQAWEKTKAKAADSAHDAVVAAKNNPWILGGIGAAIGLYLSRGALGRLAGDAWDRITGNEEEGGESPAPAAPRADPPETPAEVAKRAQKTKAPAPRKRAGASKKTKTEEVK